MIDPVRREARFGPDRRQALYAVLKGLLQFGLSGPGSGRTRPPGSMSIDQVTHAVWMDMLFGGHSRTLAQPTCLAPRPESANRLASEHQLFKAQLSQPGFELSLREAVSSPLNREVVCTGVDRAERVAVTDRSKITVEPERR